MKKEISDHIARTFFEKKKPVRKKDVKRIPRHHLWTLLFLTFVLLAGAGAKIVLRSKDAPNETVRYLSLVKHDGPYRLSFNFENKLTSRVETFTIEVPEIDLRGYKKIRFSLRLIGDDNQKDGIVKVSLVNKRNEISSLYIQNVGPSWKRVEFPCQDFRSLSDWSGLRKLSFTLEEWNVRPQKGVLFIDSIEFINTTS